jgi:hypothetical protein
VNTYKTKEFSFSKIQAYGLELIIKDDDTFDVASPVTCFFSQGDNQNPDSDVND